MAKHDPTDDVLATIARIFEHAEAAKPKPATEAKPLPERVPIVNPFSMRREAPSAAEPARTAPAPEPPMEAQAPAVAEAAPAAVPSAPEPVAEEIESYIDLDAPVDPPPIGDGYSRAGPGPIEAIRFRWTARGDGKGGFFVDETIGANSRAIVSGPMSGEDAVAFIDLQVQEAFERFERLKQSAAELPTRRGAQPEVEPVHAEHDAGEDEGS